MELKSSFSEWKEIVISLCAFANKNGGSVIVGLDDSGQPLGKEFGKGAIEDIANKIKQNTDPTLYPSINVQTFGLGEIIEIEIPESDNKPVFAFERAYIRVGKTTQKLSTTEVRGLIKRYALSNIDEQAVEELKVADFKLDEKFARKMNYSSKVKDKKITYGEYLCFTEKNNLFHNAIVKAARFKGVKPVDFIDEKQFDGSILSAPKGIMAFIQRHINKQIVITGKARHDEIWDYPIEALREAVMNAIVHRDYTDSGNIQIRIFDDRIEIWSPGLLPKEIDVFEIYKQARSVPRNKLIVRIFHEAGLIENWGTGFQRMLALCRENNNPDPEFSDRSAAFVVSFKKRKENVPENVPKNVPKNVPENVPENRIGLIYQLMKDNQSITAFELSKKMNVNEKTIKRDIDKLKKEKRIRRVGPDKGGYWEVITKQK